MSFAALGFVSCNDWLELTPTDQVSDKSAWESEEATDLYVNNFYEYIALYGQFGDQPWENVWLSLSRKLQLSLYFPQYHRVLATVAHLALLVVS